MKVEVYKRMCVVGDELYEKWVETGGDTPTVLLLSEIGGVRIEPGGICIVYMKAGGEYRWLSDTGVAAVEWYDTMTRLLGFAPDTKMVNWGEREKV